MLENETATNIQKLSYHAPCRNIDLTNLKLADYFMVLPDGKLRSVKKSIMAVFDDFEKALDLRIDFNGFT